MHLIYLQIISSHNVYIWICVYSFCIKAENCTTEVCSILLKETKLNLILFSNIFFISSRAACQNLAEYSKNCVNLSVTDASGQLLKNECLLIRSQLNATTTEVTSHE